MKAATGYAPGAVRDAFLMALECDDNALQRRMAEGLTNCGNPLPGMTCDALALPYGSSYGAAARLVLSRTVP
jgi:hypothetical protein